MEVTITIINMCAVTAKDGVWQALKKSMNKRLEISG